MPGCCTISLLGQPPIDAVQQWWLSVEWAPLKFIRYYSTHAILLNCWESLKWINILPKKKKTMLKYFNFEVVACSNRITSFPSFFGVNSSPHLTTAEGWDTFWIPLGVYAMIALQKDAQLAGDGWEGIHRCSYQQWCYLTRVRTLKRHIWGA